MSKSRVALDVMGGDHGAPVTMEAAAAISRDTSINLLLVGDPDAIARGLDSHEHDPKRIEVMPAHDVIGQDEKPRKAIDTKPDASLCRAMRAAADGDASAFVSAGSTGAIVLAAARWVPKIDGVKRAALAAVYPTKERRGNPDRFALMLDVGATVRCTPTDLLFFGYMGNAYASRISKVKRPSIGLLNMGKEETKGGEVLSSAHRLMKEDEVLNFIGNLEGNDIPMGVCDVVVCEGLVGNVALKMGEGVGEVLKSVSKWAFKQNLMWKAGLTLLARGLRQLKDITDYSEYGGAPLLGFARPVLKAHGRSGARAIANAIKVAAKADRDDVCGEIARAVAEFQARVDAPSRS
ncbi:MAG: phosphate acyltransferase PlsX [Nannocystaceae bacterium]|nr:phosphate acyltransferase PlsX [bacterium]